VPVGDVAAVVAGGGHFGGCGGLVGLFGWGWCLLWL
jgi:hypothetical protein